MPTNRDEIRALERDTLADLGRRAGVEQLSRLLEHESQALVRGPLELPEGLHMEPGGALHIPWGNSLVVFSGKRLREILPAGDYPAASWLNGPPVTLYLVETAERAMQIKSWDEIQLRYPLTATEDLLCPHMIDVALIYRVSAPERIFRAADSPLLALYDTVYGLLRQVADGQQIDRLDACTQQILDQLIARRALADLGFEIQALRVIGLPIPTPPEDSAAGAALAASKTLSIIEAQLAELKGRRLPIFGRVERVAEGYQITMPLFSLDRQQRRIVVTCDLSYPVSPPRLVVDDQPWTDRPALLREWRPQYTLANLIDAAIEAL